MFFAGRQISKPRQCRLARGYRERHHLYRLLLFLSFYLFKSTIFSCNSLFPFHSLTSSSKTISIVSLLFNLVHQLPKQKPMVFLIISVLCLTIRRKCLASLPTVCSSLIVKSLAKNFGLRFPSPKGMN